MKDHLVGGVEDHHRVQEVVVVGGAEGRASSISIIRVKSEPKQLILCRFRDGGIREHEMNLLRRWCT